MGVAGTEVAGEEATGECACEEASAFEEAPLARCCLGSSDEGPPKLGVEAI